MIFRVLVRFSPFWTSKIQTWYATEAWTFIDEVWILPFFVHFQWNGSTVIELKLSGCFSKAYRHSDLKLGSTQRAQCDAYQSVSCAKPSTSLSLGALVHFQRNNRFFLCGSNPCRAFVQDTVRIVVWLLFIPILKKCHLLVFSRLYD